MSVDLSQTHLKTVHVIAVVAAIISAGLFVGGAYIGLKWEVKELSNAQKEIPTQKDLTVLHTALSTELTHAASDRVKFYMEHAKLECDPAPRGKKQNCRLIWPVPSED